MPFEGARRRSKDGPNLGRTGGPRDRKRRPRPSMMGREPTRWRALVDQHAQRRSTWVPWSRRADRTGRGVMGETRKLRWEGTTWRSHDQPSGNRAGGIMTPSQAPSLPLEHGRSCQTDEGHPEKTIVSDPAPLVASCGGDERKDQRHGDVDRQR